MVELRHLRSFVAVAEELHFGHAAERLQIAQPALSRQIARLEREVGATLLNRTRRRVELTDAGRLFLEEARQTLVQAERALLAAQRVSRGEIGRLLVMFGPTAELGLLPEVLPVFLRRYPGVELDLRSLYATDQLALIQSTPHAVGLTLLPMAGSDGISVEALYSEPLIVALPEKHRLAGRREIPLTALADEPFIIFPRRLGPALHDRVVRAFDEAGVTLNIQHDSTHLYTNLGLVAAGVGVSLLPRSIECLSRSGVVYRQLAPPVPTIDLGVVRRAADGAPVVQKFVEVVREVVRRRSVRSLTSAPRVAPARGVVAKSRRGRG